MLPISGQPNGQGGALSPATNTAGGVGGPSASPPGGTPKSMRRQRPPQTFAGMQQQGVARPSPELVQQQTAMNQQAAQAQQAAQMAQPTQQSATQAAQQTVANSAPLAAQPMSGQNAGGQNPQLASFLNQQVMALLQDPTQGLNEAAQSNFDRQARGMDREFTTLREGLNENMAARGLDASTIAATKLGDLGARQAEAMSDMGARVQEQLVRDRSAAMQNAIQSAMGLRGQDAELDQMLWSRSDADRRFGLDQTLGLGNLDINRQNLALSRDRFGYDQARDERNFNYGVDRDTRNDAFRDRQFDWQRSTDERDFDYRQNRDTIGDQQWQSNFDRQGNWRTEDNQYRDRRDTVADERFNRTFDRDQTWRNEDRDYRDTRDKTEDERFNKTFDWNKSNANTQNILSIAQSMGLNSIDPKVLQQIFSSLGITMPGGGSGNAPTAGGTGGSSGGWRSDYDRFY